MGTASHEDFSRTHTVRGSSDRSFGALISGVFFVIALLPLRHGGVVRWWALALGCALAVAAALFPVLLRPLNRAWFRLGLLMGRIINPVVLAVLFHGVLTPFGVVMRGLGKDPLRLRPDPGMRSYWIERNPPGPAPGTMANQF
jgi:hypothetical protein